MGAVAFDVGTQEGRRHMAVPDDLFRRRTVWRRLQSVEKALERFHEATDFDNKIAAEAVNYDLAAKIIKRASSDNTELALECVRRRDAALERAKQRKPLRNRPRRVR